MASEAKNTPKYHPTTAQTQLGPNDHDLESQNGDQPAAADHKRVHGRDLDAVYKRLMDDLEHEMATQTLPWWRSRKVGFEIFVLLSLIIILVVSANKRWELCTLSFSSCTVLGIFVLSGLSIVRLATFLLAQPILRRFRIHKYAVFFIRRVKIYVDVILWLALTLLVWYAWFRPQLVAAAAKKHHERDLKFHVTRFLIALILGAILWLLKNILYLKLEADLHYGQLFDRIQRSVVFVHGIELIRSKYGSWYFLARSEKNIWMDVMRMKKESTPVRILECLSRKYLQHVMYDNPSLMEKFESFKNDRELIEEAEGLLREVIPDKGRQYITEKDLKKYGLTKEEMEVLFTKYAEKDGGKSNQKGGVDDHGMVITRDKFLNWVVRAYKSCSNMNRILSSSTAVFVKLNRLISTIIITVVIIIWLIMSRLVDSAQIALVFSPFLAVNFMFGDSCKKMFDGLIFAFAMHPFDVGDRVIVDNMQMRVDELNILTTVFYKYDTEELSVYPNSQLANKNIVNLDITPDQADVLNFSIPEETPLEDIKDLEIKIKIALDEDPKYDSDIKVVRKEIVEWRLQMAVHFKYLVSYLSNETKAEHKSDILTMIMELYNEIKKPSNGCGAAALVTEIMYFSPRIKPTKLEHINLLKREILSVVGTNYKEHSKVVMTKLTENKDIEIAIYLRTYGRDRHADDYEEKGDRSGCCTSVKDTETLREAIQSKLSELMKENITREI